VPGELLTERGIVIGLDTLNDEGQMLAGLLEELSRRMGVVVIVDAQNAKARGFVSAAAFEVSFWI
jgi:hypothetical protein